MSKKNRHSNKTTGKDVTVQNVNYSKGIETSLTKKKTIKRVYKHLKNLKITIHKKSRFTVVP